MDNDLRSRLNAFADPTEHSNWPEVLRLAERFRRDERRNRRRWLSRPRLTLAVAPIVVVSLIVAPALAIRGGLLDFSQGQPAPTPIQSDFRSLDIGAPAGMAPGISAKARRVITIQGTDSPHSLWVAPTHGGGFCVQMDRLGGGCDRDRELPLAVEMGRKAMASPVLIWGSTLHDDVRSIDLEYEDGGMATLEVTSVTSPIDATFFLYELPEARTKAGARPIAAVARRADGEVLARTPILSGGMFTKKARTR